MRLYLDWNKAIEFLRGRAAGVSPRTRVWAAGLSIALIALALFNYIRFSMLVNDMLRSGPFANTSDFYAAPRAIVPGEAVSTPELAAELRQSGYTPSPEARAGNYRVRPEGVEIIPSPRSYAAREPVFVQITGGKIARIVSLEDRKDRPQYQLEPPLITNLSGRNREKRRLVWFADIPKVLVQAVLSAEDKRFFQHSGFDTLRILKAAYVDLKEGRKEQGASTLSMQVARSLWLGKEKSWTRKFSELMIAIQLEQKLAKEQIFEMYCNQVYLGRRGTFSIHGFGEGARAYFGKDIGQLTLPEAALLAGLVQRPGYYNPFRTPERVEERRNVVLALMRENGYIDQQQYGDAALAPLNITPGVLESGDAPYFLDLAQDELQSRLEGSDESVKAHRVYTTIDLDLQRAATEAIRIGMEKLDRRILKSRQKNQDPTLPQVALIALDPRTGEIKALSGGRDYNASQLNRTLAKRQPGSVFKPFVYAAALNTPVAGGRALFTPASTVLDEPTTFWFANQPYTPANFGEAFYGEVTLRAALARSLNVATIKVAEAVGYGAVAEIAHRAGLEDAQPTPAMALGSYDATPLDVAGAYTVFANHGTYVKPTFISMIRSRDGQLLYEHIPEKRPALDPRVAYLMVNMLEGVVNYGTGAAVRGMGFSAPAAGKTGTSRDGWFAGFTTELLCVVWVGYDDHRDLKLEGSKSALPIWAEFMKRALPYTAGAKPFRPPAGIVSAEIDKFTGELATEYCPETRNEVFIAGTEPGASCALHRGSQARAGAIYTSN